MDIDRSLLGAFGDFQEQNRRVATRQLHQQSMSAKCSGTFFSTKDRRSLERAAELRDQSFSDIEPIQATKKPGRNQTCPCGSGDKYKYCCGVNPT